MLIEAISPSDVGAWAVKGEPHRLMLLKVLDGQISIVVVLPQTFI
jgi:hypothetical protein